uniref:Tigger transposable element-derived protein 5-like n=1 Tax=Saccoglossus kowalevskii TaxID=10224 RepID=A0ABM0M133_SACKO|nr:PREDICTED: tigger transposable element-derived protein 5-like [Saccoglossus kowalevskii]
MDQGIIRSFKANYRRELLLQLLLDPEYSSLNTGLKSYTIKDTCYITAKAWRQVKSESIEKCWMKGLGPAFSIEPSTNDEVVNNPEQESVSQLIDTAASNGLATDYTENTLMDWITADNDIPTFELLSDGGIAALISGCETPIPSDDEEETDKENMEPPPTSTDAIKGLETALEFFESATGNDIDGLKLMQLKGLIDCCKTIQSRKQRQASITHFLK